MGKIKQLGNSNGLGSNKQISLTQYIYLQKKNTDSVSSSNCFSIDNNSKQLKFNYEFDNGYFGKKGSSSSRRVIYVDDPILASKNFFDIISNGYIYKKEEKNAIIVKLPDNSILTYRVVTKSGKNGESPAVDINLSNVYTNTSVKTQKIHFERKI